VFKSRVTNEQACQLVLQHLQVLKALCDKQFPDNGALAEEAQNHVLDTLKSENWARIQHWDQKSKFATFLSVVAGRMLIDFRRKQFGHQRPPEWLKREKDPLWMVAYMLLIKKNYSRTEAIEILTMHDVSRERSFIENLVNQVIAKCKRPVKPVEHTFDDYEPWLMSSNPGPLAEIEQSQVRTISAALMQLVGWDQDMEEEASTELTDHIKELRTHLEIGDEEKLILKMHFLEGRKLSEIKRMLNFSGDIHKRYFKILKQCNNALQHSGLLKGK
jgi:RNA polymerase sigma factor (sigma-70 family)